MDDASISKGEAIKGRGRGLMRQAALVGGQWVAEGEAIAVDDPSDGSIIGYVPALSKARVEEAIKAAADAFPAWAATPEFGRGGLLRLWADLIDDNRDGLAALLALENGKPYAEAQGEVDYANSFVKWFAAEADRLNGDVIPSPVRGHRIVTFKEPVGPVAAITPWNFPAAMITRKVAPALAAGCTVVLKPASQTPFTALALGALALEAGFPPGVLNVVTGANDVVGPALTGSKLIRKLSFTGSTPVGRLLAEQCAPTLKRLSMELGGAAPLIVFEDADLDVAVDGTIAGKFRCSGQTCVCPNRVYVHESIKEAFLERLTARVATLKVGAPFDEGVKVGPLIDEKGLAKVEDHVSRTVAAGGRILAGGQRHALGGRFFQPTVLDGGDEALFRQEETFGPVVPVFGFTSEKEVVALANASDYGLASYVFTKDLDRAMRVGRAIEAGMVGVNVGLMSNAANPFGGVKQSGYGREGSVYGIDEYVNIKAVTLGLR